jgi:hypothetical protein
MKYTIKLLIVALGLLTWAHAEIKTAVYTGNTAHIDVPDGTTIEIIYLQQEHLVGSAPPAQIGIEWLPGGDTPHFPYFRISEFTSEAPFKNGIFAGPIRIELGLNNTNALMTYRLTNAESGLSAAAPSNTVVIPEDIAGTVSVILESSTDLLSWTAANPGTYGASTSKRFFRLRASQN